MQFDGLSCIDGGVHCYSQAPSTSIATGCSRRGGRRATLGDACGRLSTGVLGRTAGVVGADAAQTTLTMDRAETEAFDHGVAEACVSE